VFLAHTFVVYQLFSKWNIQTSILILTSQKLLKVSSHRIQDSFAESPTNPAVDIIDLELLGKLPKKHNLILIIDNCFATPYLQQPKWGSAFGSAFCYKVNGWSRTCLGGVTVGDPELIQKIYLFSRLTDLLIPLMLGYYQKFRDFGFV
jgi:O-succinylhomoserine sulfhydrylase